VPGPLPATAMPSTSLSNSRASEATWKSFAGSQMEAVPTPRRSLFSSRASEAMWRSFGVLPKAAIRMPPTC